MPVGVGWLADGALAEVGGIWLTLHWSDWMDCFSSPRPFDTPDSSLHSLSSLLEMSVSSLSVDSNADGVGDVELEKRRRSSCSLLMFSLSVFSDLSWDDTADASVLVDWLSFPSMAIAIWLGRD